MNILSAILRDTELLANPTIVKNLDKTIVVLERLAKFQSSLKNELSEEEKSVLVDFAIMNSKEIGDKIGEIEAADVQKCQLPLLSALLEEQKEIFDENVDQLDSKKIASLYASVTSWLDEKNQESKGKIIALLPKSSLNVKLLEEGLKNLTKVENPEDFRRQIEFMVEISNNCDEKGHQKIISCVKDILAATALLDCDTFTTELENKKLLTALTYATQMALSLDDKKRSPSSDLNISQRGDKTAELNKKLCTYTTTQRDFRNQHWLV